MKLLLVFVCAYLSSLTTASQLNNTVATVGDFYHPDYYNIRDYEYDPKGGERCIIKGSGFGYSLSQFESMDLILAQRKWQPEGTDLEQNPPEYVQTNFIT